MNTVLDIAAFILSEKGAMSTMELQKLCYYSQAWSLVWFDEPLFSEPFEAWAYGPVCSALFSFHRGKFHVSSIDGGESERVPENRRDAIRGVIEHYSKLSAQQLSDLTHYEDPWRHARGGLPSSIRSNEIISHASMKTYYASLQQHG